MFLDWFHSASVAIVLRFLLCVSFIPFLAGAPPGCQFLQTTLIKYNNQGPTVSVSPSSILLGPLPTDVLTAGGVVGRPASQTKPRGEGSRKT